MGMHNILLDSDSLNKCRIKGLIKLLTFIICSISTVDAANYYWIGGSGLWSDISNWSSTSGGNPSFTVIPGPGDHVFFDDKGLDAGATIITMPAISYCNNFNFTATKQVRFQSAGGGGFTLQLNGSLNGTSNFIYPTSMILSFQGNNYYNIVLPSFNLAEIRINGSGTGTLADSGRVALITQSNGVLNITSPEIDITRFIFSTNNLKILRIRTQNIKLRNFESYSTADSVDGIGSYVRDFRFFRPRSSSLWFGKIQLFQDINFSLNGAINAEHLIVERVYLNWATDLASFDTISMVEGSFLFNENASSVVRTKVLHCMGTCTKPITLYSATRNSLRVEGIVESVSDYTNFYKIEFSQLLDANNSVDAGYNININFVNPVVPKRVYWIGNTGNFDNPNNWSDQSGGSPRACIPTPADTIVVDENSFGSSGTINFDFDIFVGGVEINSSRFGGFRSTNTAKNMTVHGSFQIFTPSFRFFDILFLKIRTINKDPILRTTGRQMPTVVFYGDTSTLYMVDDTLLCMNFRVENGEVNIQKKVIIAAQEVKFEQEVFTGIKMEESFIEARQFLSSLTNPSYLFGNLSQLWITDKVEVKGDSFQFYNLHIFRKVVAVFSGQYDLNHSWFNKITVSNFGTHSYKGTYTDTIIFFKGFTSYFASSTYNVSKLFFAEGSCDSTLYISSDFRSPNFEVRATASTQFVLNRVSLKQMFITGKTGVNATSSVNVLGCQGITFVQPQSRTLYWVGGSGNWNNPMRWSLTSGGPPVNCLPTSLDTVIVDHNSSALSGDSMIILANEIAMCRVFDASRLNKPFRISGGLYLGEVETFLIRNSAYFSHHLITQNQRITFFGTFNSSEIKLNGLRNAEMEWRFLGGGDWKIRDKISFLHRLRVINAGVELQGDSAGFRVVNVGWTHGIFSKASLYSANTAIGTWEFYKSTHGQLGLLKSPMFFVNVFQSQNTQATDSFSHIQSRTPLRDFKTPAIFHLDGYAKFLKIEGMLDKSGKMEVDSFINYNSERLRYSNLSLPKYNYHQYYEVLGNNCMKTQVTNNMGGTPTITSNTAQFNCDFLVLSNVRAQGSASFFAGVNSINQGNAQGWILNGNPFIETKKLANIDNFLVCRDSIYVDAREFYGMAQSFNWSHGIQTPDFWTKKAGRYFLTATYTNNCRLRDTLMVDIIDSGDRILPPDTFYCRIDSVELKAEVPNARFWKFLWNTGDTTQSIWVGQSGTYSLQLSRQDCPFADTTTVLFTGFAGPLPLVPDTTICFGDTFSIDLNQQSSYIQNVIWNNRDTGNIFFTKVPGEYYLKYGDKYCDFYDTFSVHVTQLNMFLNAPEEFCEGTTVTIRPEPLSGQFLWGDTLQVDSLLIDQGGWFSVTRYDSLCSIKDSIQVLLIKRDSFELEVQDKFCEGQNARISVNPANTAVTWWDGGTQPYRIVNESGFYSAYSTVKFCRFFDSVFTEEIKLPSYNLTDTLLCRGDSLRIELQSDDGLMYFFQGQSVTQPILIMNEGVYRFSFTKDMCGDSNTFSVQVKERPIADILDSLSFCEQSFPGNRFIDNRTQWLTWEDTKLEANIRMFEKPGSYPYTLSDTSGCDLNGEVIVSPCDCELFFPNAFTPNKDLKNEVFRPSDCWLKSFKMQIYSRWGELLFETNDLFEGWDGTFKGEPCHDGVYIWIASYETYLTLSATKRSDQKGIVVLMR